MDDLFEEGPYAGVDDDDNNEDDDDEGDKEVAKLHNCVDKILKEF